MLGPSLLQRDAALSARRCSIFRSLRQSSPQTIASGRFVIARAADDAGPLAQRMLSAVLSTTLSVVAPEVLGVLGPPFPHGFGVSATAPGVQASDTCSTGQLVRGGVKGRTVWLRGS
jgi:hypothetical protein